MASSHREVDRDEERTYRRQERSPRDESHPRRVRNSRSRSPAARLDSRRQLIRSPSPDENPSRPVRLRRSDYEIEDTENNRPRDRVVRAIYIQYNKLADSFVQKYRRLQAHSNDQEKRIRQLEGRLSDISNADLDPAERRRVQRENERQLASDAEEEDGDRNSSAEDDVSQPTEVVQRGAQLFFLTHSPWLCQEGSAFKADKDLRYTPDQRFKNKFTRVQGQRADLQEVLSNVWTGNKAAPAWVIRTVRLHQFISSFISVHHNRCFSSIPAMVLNAQTRQAGYGTNAQSCLTLLRKTSRVLWPVTRSSRKGLVTRSMGLRASTHRGPYLSYMKMSRRSLT